MPLLKRSIKHRLLNGRYFYIHGFFDLVRRREKNILFPFTPNELCTLYEGDWEAYDSLVLVNAEHPRKTDIDTKLLTADGVHEVLPLAGKPFERLMRASLQECGEALQITSAYRTLAEQERIFGINPFAVPAGESEHHTGLAADIKVEGYAGRRFLLTKAGKWVAKNAHRFGFTVRYPLWAEKRTGVDYEPWHLRYVGLPHAEILYRQKITLEEYLDALKEGVFFRFGNTVIVRETGDAVTFLPNAARVYASVADHGSKIVWGDIG